LGAVTRNKEIRQRRTRQKRRRKRLKKALTQAPDPLNKKGLETMIQDLEAGKAIAQ